MVEINDWSDDKLQTSLNVVHILKELNIPIKRFEQWKIEGAETDTISNPSLETAASSCAGP